MILAVSDNPGAFFLCSISAFGVSFGRSSVNSSPSASCRFRINSFLMFPICSLEYSFPSQMTLDDL